MHKLSLIRTIIPIGLMLLAAFPPTAAAQTGTVVRLDPTALTLRPGESGEVAVLVEGVTDLAGAEIHLEYDPDLLEVVDADPEEDGVQIAHGGFLWADFVAQNRAEGGRIDYAIARMPPHEPVSGDGTLAVITLRAKGDRSSTLVLREVLLANPQGHPIAAEITADIAAVSAPSPTCWPGGVVILGLMALLLLPRERKHSPLAKSSEVVYNQ